MTRAERLLELLQMLRGYRYPISGQKLAKRLNVSLRTLYRDIATLQAQGAEIEGEAGMGYVLKPGFFLPPLMFSQAEIEALLLGIQWVSQYGDKPLTISAVDVASKITQVLPSNVKKEINSYSLRVGPPIEESLMEEGLSFSARSYSQSKENFS